jgi:outer membrane lipoprotein SlyB
MKNNLVFMTASVLVTCAILSGCSRNISPDTYTGTDVGVVSRVKSGVIVAERPVTIDNNSGVGVLSGATAGGAAGSLIGGNTATNVVGAVGGVVVGGVVGNAIDKSINTHQGIEYIIKLDDGPTVSVTQVEDLKFNVHQRVLVIYGEMTRIIADNTVSTSKSSQTTKANSNANK